MASAIFKYVFLPLSLFSSVLNASKLENIFSESQLKQIKVVATVVVVAGATYTVYKIGEYTIKAVKYVHRKYREYQRELLLRQIKGDTEELKSNALNLSEITKISEEHIEKTAERLLQIRSTKQNTSDSLDNIEKNFDHSREVLKGISEINQDTTNLLNAFNKSAKTGNQNFSEYSTQKKLTRNEEKGSFDTYQKHDMQTGDIEQSCTITQNQCKNSHMLSLGLDTQTQGLSQAFGKRLSTDLNKED